MSHFRKALEGAITSKDLLQVFKDLEPKDVPTFVKEGAAYAGERTEKDGRRLFSQDVEEEAFKEILCRAAARESPETLKMVEGRLGFKLRDNPLLGLLEALGGVSSTVLLVGGACPGCSNCQPERFDGKTVDTTGYTVNEEPPSEAARRQLPPKSG